MPEIMNVTNPVPAREPAAANRSIPNTAYDPGIQNVPNPGRVNRSDSNSGQQHAAGEESGSLPLRYDSNFQAFLQRVSESGDSVSADLLRALTGGTRTTVSSGLRAGSAGDLSQILDLLRMNEGEFLRFLQDQSVSASRFGGAFFAALRNAYRAADSQGLRSDILQFLKQYGDFSSTAHIEDNLLRGLNRIISSLPRSWGAQVSDFTGQLQNSMLAGDRAGALKLLQGQIIPYLSDYISRSHDMGRVRSALSMLTLDIARYESGSQEGMLQALRRLFDHPSLRGALGDLRGSEDAALLRMLKNTPFERTGRNNPFADRLASAADMALRGSAGVEAQERFGAMVASMLVNESVYMPLNHFVLPLVWNERMMYSEIWVDPDADGDDRPQEDEARTLRFLLKADVEPLGLFDIVITSRGSSVDLAVRCPESVAPFSDVIRSSLSGILADNGFSAGSVDVEKMVKPLTVSEIFPKIFSGKDSVNVRA
ncbi:hypothetical protein [Oscillibacter sp.]|uniref:hypothetical protein n=1 Tax=Oscillibacter sp. TaxID=1945593 RepID=UPI002897779B|nr:hypothetical protein [Oscillibacter sp.]